MGEGGPQFLAETTAVTRVDLLIDSAGNHVESVAREEDEPPDSYRVAVFHAGEIVQICLWLPVNRNCGLPGQHCEC